MKTVDINQVQMSVQELISMIQEDTEVVLTEGNKPIARIILVADHAEKNADLTRFSVQMPRKPGLNPGSIWISDDFDEPLPDEFWLGEA